MKSVPSNAEIARLLSNMAVFYEMEGVQFKPRAYERAAEAVETLDETVADVFARGGRKALDGIPGVGPGIAAHLEEILTTGTFEEYKRMRKRVPVAVEELNPVEGIGPKMIKVLYQQLRIKNLKDLEAAARAGKIKKIPHFGAKSEEKILKGIEFLKKSKGRFLLGSIQPTVRDMEERLRKIPGVGQVTTAGSYRRWQETVGDIDILVTAKDAELVMDAFVKFPEVEHVFGRGPTKVNVRLRQGIDADIRVLKPNEYGSALQYFTGDKMHNIETRKIAIKKGCKLSEYGLFSGKKLIAGKTEEEVYKKLGLDWIPPELRTASGEIEAARSDQLPNLVEYGSIRGDCQVQTSWTDGSHSIEDMAKAAMSHGLEYMVVTDHTRALAMTGGLDEKKLAQQGKEINALNKKLGKRFRILKGAEINILKDGTLDISDGMLKKLDAVAVSVHSHFGMRESEMTERIIRAIKNPLVNILFHPTGRLIGKREPYQVDILKVLRAAKEYGVAMEVNAFPERLDLRDAHIRDAVKLGVKLVVDSDAHAPHHFQYLDLGVAQVRRGWGSKSDVLNTKAVDDFLKSLKGLKR